MDEKNKNNEQSTQPEPAERIDATSQTTEGVDYMSPETRSARARALSFQIEGLREEIADLRARKEAGEDVQTAIDDAWSVLRQTEVDRVGILAMGDTYPEQI